MSSSIPGDAPRPRLCHIRKWVDAEGYGFNLQAEKGKPGHFLGKVDVGSPSEAGGLQEGDLIVEVNGTNIDNENHQQVVQRIKAVSNEVKMLVVDHVAEKYYTERAMVVHSDMSNVERITTPVTKEEFLADPRAGYVLAAAVIANGVVEAEVEPSPRLCILHQWSDFQGYGFNLTAEKNRPGQFIGNVDNDSPASTAGLREGDRIIEVNGANVLEETHQQVVGRIKSTPGTVSLLVVDLAADDFYKKLNKVVSGNMVNVIRGETPDRNSGASEPVTVEEAVATVAVVAAVAEAAAEPAPPAPAPASYDVIDSSPPTTEEVKTAVDVAVAATVVAAVASAEPLAPRPRLCTIRKWQDFQGYGFNLQASRAVHGNFIGSVDDNSPALAGGLKSGDKIIEVNGSNVYDDTHHQVVEKIKSRPGCLVLLVVDEEAEKYYLEKAINVHGDMDNLEVITCPEDRLTPEEVAVVATVVAAAAHEEEKKQEEAAAIAVLVAAAAAREEEKKQEEAAAMAVLVAAAREEEKKQEEAAAVAIVVAAAAAHEEEKKQEEAAAIATVVAAAAAHEEEKKHEEEAAVATAVAATVAVAAVATVAASEPVDDGPALRLCHIKKWSTFSGYGFNLNAEKGKVGNFIGGVDPASPAEAAGVRKDDYIIEVNGEYVAESDHKTCVSKILIHPDHVKMLLITPSDAEYYKQKAMRIDNTLKNIIVHTCPDVADMTANVQSNGHPEVHPDTKPATSSSGAFAIRSSVSSPEADPIGGASLKEALDRIKSRKKPAARTGNLSMKEKFELFQQL